MSDPYREGDDLSKLAAPPVGKVHYLVRQTTDHHNARRVFAQHRNEAFAAANLQTLPRFLSLYEVDVIELDEDGKAVGR